MEAILDKEKKYFKILILISAVLWFLLIVGTLGIGLFYLLLFYIFFIFSHSALIAWLKGNGIEISAQQFPDINQMIEECCQKLQMPKPHCYIMNGNGILNAFATRFLKRNYLVLLSDVVDAFEARPDVLRFYIGHELGHIKQDHVIKFIFVIPTVILPLAYPAYRRSCEYVCDQFGRLCCNNNEDAVSGLLLLMSGLKRWKSVNVSALEKQLTDSFGFWPSFHELTSTYPWLSKRVSTIQNNNQQNFKRPHSLAILLGLFNPGFLPGSLFPIFFVYIGFIFALMIPVMISAKKLAKLGLDKQATSSATYGLTPKENIDPKRWTNSYTFKSFDMPEDFKSLPIISPTDASAGRFSFNEDVYYSYVKSYSKEFEKSLEEYLGMLKKQNIYSYDESTLKYGEIDGQKTLGFQLNPKAGAPASPLTQTVTIWMSKDYFWEFYSDYDLKNAESIRKNDLLLKLVLQSTR